MQPCVQYLPFWVDNTTDILQLVQQLKDHPANDAVARRVAANGQVRGRPRASPCALHRDWGRRLPTLHGTATERRPCAHECGPSLPHSCNPCALAARAHAQAFALAHLTEEARWRYWQTLFDQYAALYQGGEPGDPPSRNYTVLSNSCYGCQPPELPSDAAPQDAARRR